MELRRYDPKDLAEIAQLFHDTVHAIHTDNYSSEQLNAWATGDIELEDWNKSLLSHCTFVAVDKDIIVGFGEIDTTGYLDKLFVHKDFQKQGVATAICDKLEHIFVVEKVQTQASITAKPFFEKRGYKVIKKQSVERQGVCLTNYLMEKKMQIVKPY